MINVFYLSPVDVPIGSKVHCSQDAGVAESGGSRSTQASTDARVLQCCCASTHNAHTSAQHLPV